MKDTKFFPVGRMIASSKSAYRSSHPGQVIVFNANLVTDDYVKLWHGDLNVTLDQEALVEYSKSIGKPFHVLFEMDGRFANEQKPRIDRAVAHVTSHGVFFTKQ